MLVWGLLITHPFLCLPCFGVFMVAFLVGMKMLISFVICSEPRGGSQDDFEPMLKGYYDTICRSKKPALGRKRRGKKLGLNNCDGMDCAGIPKEGAAFLAVCRGKVHILK